MAGIFGSVFSAGTSKVFSGKVATITFDGISGDNLGIVTGWSIDFGRSPRPIYPLGSSAVHYVLAPPAGTLSMDRVLTDSTAIYEKLTNECEITQCTLTAGVGDCKDASKKTFVCGGVIFTGYSASMSSEAPYVAERLSASIGSLEIQ